MDFNSLTNAAKLYVIIYLSLWQAGYHALRTALIESGMSAAERDAARSDALRFLAQCEEHRRQALTERRKSARQAERRSRM